MPDNLTLRERMEALGWTLVIDDDNDLSTGWIKINGKDVVAYCTDGDRYEWERDLEACRAEMEELAEGA
jgi:hypothetical protein